MPPPPGRLPGSTDTYLLTSLRTTFAHLSTFVPTTLTLFCVFKVKLQTASEPLHLLCPLPGRHSFLSFRSQLKSQLLRETLPDHSD